MRRNAPSSRGSETGLALLAGSVALEALGPGIHPGLRLAASLILLVAGLLVSLPGWLGWARTERTLRLGMPLPSAPLCLPLAVIVVVAAALVLVGMLV